MDDVQRLLHAARESLELSQAQLAKATGVSSRTLHRIENQIGMVRFETLDVLRNFYARAGLALIELEGKHRWALIFDEKLAPFPPSENISRLYEPVPGRVLKAARILAGMTQDELSGLANMAHTTIRKLEKLDPKVSPEKTYLLQKCLEGRGVEFQKPKDGVGWMLRR